MPMTVQQVIDDSEFELSQFGLIADPGRLFRLSAEAENDFCRLTKLLVTSVTQATTAGTYLYDLQANAGLLPSTTIRVIDIFAVQYKGELLTKIPIEQLAALPSYFGNELKDRYAFTNRTTIRLAFNPETLAAASGLTFWYSYEPNATYDDWADSFAVNEAHRMPLVHYIVWKHLITDPKLQSQAKIYRALYEGAVNVSREEFKDRRAL